MGSRRAFYGGSTYYDCSTGFRSVTGVLSVSPVEKRIMELASFQLGPRKKFIRAVRRKVVIPNRRYSWLLYEHPTDSEHLESVILDVSLAEALEIDRSVRHLLIGPPIFHWELVQPTVEPSRFVAGRR